MAKPEVQDHFVDMIDLAYLNIYPVVCYAPGYGLTGRIYWPNPKAIAPKRILLCDGDSLQHAFAYISGV